MSDFSALGFDPAPGDVSAIRSFITQLDRGARSTSDALSLMDDGGGTWKGEAAVAFRHTLDNEFRPQLRDVRDAFVTSRDALSGWARELSGFQARARQLEQEAALATGSLSRRRNELAQARSEAQADPIAAATDTGLSDAARRLRAAQATLDDVRRRATALQTEADGRAAACAGQLEGGIALISAYAGSGWDRFTSWVSDVGSAIADGYEWFMDDVMPILEDIVDTIVPIIAVAALFVPALGPLALGLSIAAVGIDGLQALHGEEGAKQDFFVGLAGLAVGGALGKIGTALGNGTREVLLPAIQINSGSAMALAGGGSMAASTTLSIALHVNPQALQANTMWMATKLTEAHVAGSDLATSTGQPAVNLVERTRNLIQGNGPRTDQELADRDED
ncbi:MAG: hypothetical protein QM622_05060 [Microbacterium sp.]